MPVEIDLVQNQFETKTFTLQITPPTNVSTWGGDFIVSHRFGGVSGLIHKSWMSGYGGGQSGITVTNSGFGSFDIRVNGIDTSGMDPNLAYSYVFVTNSGVVNTRGFYILGPSIVRSV